MSKTRRLLLEFETEQVGKLARENSEVRKDLVQAMSDSSDVVRERALLASIEYSNPNIVDDIAKAMNDDEDDVRIAAAQALAYYHQPKTIPILLEGLKDSNSWVRSHCANGLSKLIHGPLWARLPEEEIDKIIADFPGMVEEDIRLYLREIQMDPEAIDSLLKWKNKDFDIEIDYSILEEELTGKPIVFEKSKIERIEPKTTADEISEILSELPDEILATLPPEDLSRLTPKTARELVNSLMESFASKEKSIEKEKKKPKTDRGKVRKVRRVQRVKTETAREEMLARLPDEVKDSMPSDVLENISIEELEALLNMTAESEDVTAKVEEAIVPEKKSPKKKKKKVVRRVRRKKKKKLTLEDISGIGPSTVESLKAAGYESVLDVAKANPDKLAEEVDGIGNATAIKIIEEAKKLTPSKTKKEKSKSKKDDLLSKLPDEVKESMGKEAIEAMTEDEIEMLISSMGEMEIEKSEPEILELTGDKKIDSLIEKYGREKAEILAQIPEDMLASIPEDQIREMDIPTLKSLSQAFEHS
ncbi:MAG: hypothetical protein GF411_09875 [Candidatus Lokiarchaeota archaeon]|nr:hypothetical protein [Candidatus Lokiarchaeota archaeon]